MKHRDQCDCVFCQLHCLECESTDLEVTFKPVLKFRNDTEDHLFIGWEDSELKVVCEGCGAELDMGAWELAIGRDKRLYPLAKAIGDAIGLGHSIAVRIGEDGAIDHEKFYFSSSSRPALELVKRSA